MPDRHRQFQPFSFLLVIPQIMPRMSGGKKKKPVRKHWEDVSQSYSHVGEIISFVGGQQCPSALQLYRISIPFFDLYK